MGIYYYMSKNSAFSLVELSIVLVILGLLTGGILAGQSLIRAAELRSVSTEYSRYATANRTFRDKYFALPGDMPNATAFWGKDNTNCASDSGTASASGTCNGNNNSFVDAATAASATGEMTQFWKQLALAGLVEGSYSGLAGSGGIYHMLPGTNSPISKIAMATWIPDSAGVGYYAGSATLYAGNYGNAFDFGGASTNGADTAILKPEEAWIIDTKMDDGKPGTGLLVIRHRTTCANSSSATDFASTYNLTDDTKRCALIFTNQH